MSETKPTEDQLRRAYTTGYRIGVMQGRGVGVPTIPDRSRTKEERAMRAKGTADGRKAGKAVGPVNRTVLPDSA